MFTFINMDYSLLKSDTIEFITSDNPVILVLYQLNEFHQSVKPKLVFHSICPQLCFSLRDNSSGAHTHRIDEEGVELFNKVIISQARRHRIFASFNPHIYELVKEEAKSRGL